MRRLPNYNRYARCPQIGSSPAEKHHVDGGKSTYREKDLASAQMIDEAPGEKIAEGASYTPSHKQGAKHQGVAVNCAIKNDREVRVDGKEAAHRKQGCHQREYTPGIPQRSEALRKIEGGRRWNVWTGKS